MKRIIYTYILALGLLSCEEKFDKPEASRSVDFDIEKDEVVDNQYWLRNISFLSNVDAEISDARLLLIDAGNGDEILNTADFSDQSFILPLQKPYLLTGQAVQINNRDALAEKTLLVDNSFDPAFWDIKKIIVKDNSVIDNFTHPVKMEIVSYQSNNISEPFVFYTGLNAFFPPGQTQFEFDPPLRIPTKDARTDEWVNQYEISIKYPGLIPQVINANVSTLLPLDDMFANNSPVIPDKIYVATFDAFMSDIDITYSWNNE